MDSKMVKELAYVKKFLEDTNGIRPHSPSGQFRNRYTHTERVFMWAKRISRGVKCDKEALYYAAVFHDIGYGNPYDRDKHGYYGQFDFLNYAKMVNMDEEKAKYIAYLIANHSYKELMFKEGTPLELILLQEADLLDELGPLGIEAGSIRGGYNHVSSYEECFEVHLKELEGIRNTKMITPLAKKYLALKEKQTVRYIKDLAFDLGKKVKL